MMEMSSQSFREGAEIPRKHGYKHGNVSPQITISGAPPGTKSLAIIMDDPDAMEPAGKVWVHWLLWNVNPEMCTMPPGQVPSGSVQGVTDFGEAKYGGPAPPDKRHTYVFRAFALDAVLDLADGSSKDDLEGAMDGHVLARSTLTGTYAP